MRQWIVLTLDRRTLVSLIAIGCLTFIGIHDKIDVSLAIAGVAAALSGSNALDSKRKELTGDKD